VTSHLVDGRPMPDRIAGHRALEFCNTKALWGRPDENEYLTDHRAAVIWARHHDVITPAESKQLVRASPARQRDTLRRLRALRSGLYYAAIADGPLDEVHDFVARAVARSQYVPDGPALRLHVPFGPAVLVDRVALDVHHLLETYGTSAVGLCASEACGWVFLDPAHRRRWCVMAVCGNRAKARRHAQRTRTRQPAQPTRAR
jgi:predicted RNA-binding Zn ribbon-like protein